jgi:Tol biopolymer transport system component
VAISIAATSADAAFPGDNGPIAFRQTVGPGQVDVFSTEADGTGRRNLTNNGDFNTSPAYSPDGSLIAFVRNFDIWVMNVDGTGQRNVTNDPGDGNPDDNDPTFTPDGQHIVYVRDTNNAASPDEVFRIGVDGSNPTALTATGPGAELSPRVSPDGTRIAWARDLIAMNGPDEIFVMGIDGSNPTNITNFGDNVSTNSPDFSPDGTKIAFSRDGDIWDMDADGANQQNLTPGPFVDGIQPSYSPEGTAIAFARDTGGVGTVDEIFTLGAGGLANVTNSTEEESEPAWGGRDVTPPETTITKKPRKRTGRRRPKFAFEASEAATFECRLDKQKWKACASPRKLKKRLKPRRHRFRVRAIDISGNVDPTPARHRFRVKP